jgi:acrylyl-CoA reductase (NADPH)
LNFLPPNQPARLTTVTMPSSFPAFVATKQFDADGKVTGVHRAVGELASADLPAGEVTVRVHYSSVNYKDALATLIDGGVTRQNVLVPGIDLAGEVVAVDGEASVKVGDIVIANGNELGTGRHGGYAQFARLPADWVMALPGGLSPREAMAIGTAGFTAAASVHALENAGVQPGRGKVLVTGATGGVGSTAVGILAKRGYEVVASTGKTDHDDFLRSLGASDIVRRDETSAESKRPLEGERWAAAVDCVGGSTLAYVLRTLIYGGSVAASGLTGGVALSTTVLPFILRGVNLLGIDSVMIPMSVRRDIWQRCATDLKPVGIDGELVTEIGLDGLDAALTAIRAGQTIGRYVVKL